MILLQIAEEITEKYLLFVVEAIHNICILQVLTFRNKAFWIILRNELWSPVPRNKKPVRLSQKRPGLLSCNLCICKLGQKIDGLWFQCRLPWSGGIVKVTWHVYNATVKPKLKIKWYLLQFSDPVHTIDFDLCMIVVQLALVVYSIQCTRELGWNSLKIIGRTAWSQKLGSIFMSIFRH